LEECTAIEITGQESTEELIELLEAELRRP
jgi:hypothetical protein